MNFCWWTLFSGRTQIQACQRRQGPWAAFTSPQPPCARQPRARRPRGTPETFLAFIQRDINCPSGKSPVLRPPGTNPPRATRGDVAFFSPMLVSFFFLCHRCRGRPGCFSIQAGKWEEMNTQNGNGVVVFHLIPLEKGVQSDLLLGMEPQPLKGDSKGKPCKPRF